ncbi:MAG: FG-GAP repeat protein [Candidatus Omnitrophica bacterium]|nr:FG-GAP repeat protein [Candidatus Omnitrophota bacterium]
MLLTLPIALDSPNPEGGGNFGFTNIVPDVRGPGLGNVIVGGPYEDPTPSTADGGNVYIFNGSTGELEKYLVSPNLQANGRFGFPPSPVPDTNGNGFWDFAVGAYRESSGDSPSEAGRAYIFDGSTYEPLKTFVSPNEEEIGYFGRRVAGLGDVTGDGRGDLFVGASGESPGESPPNSGRAYVFDGSSGAVIHTLISPNEQGAGQFGRSAGRVPDTNGDGMDDIVTGALGEAPSNFFLAGRAYLFDGSTGNLRHTFESPTPETNGQFGWVVNGLNDVNGDGRGDVVVGAPYEAPGGSPQDAGRAYIFDGSTGALLRTLKSPDEGFLMGETGSGFGFVVSGLSDWNGDGLGEVAIGEEHGGPDRFGQVYIFDGSNGDLIHTIRSTSPTADNDGVFAFPKGGQLNGDGIEDLVVGAYREIPPTFDHRAGRAYIFHSPFPDVSIEPKEIHFASQTIGDGPSGSTTITLTNNSGGSLDITDLGLIGSYGDQFTITGDSGEDLLETGMSRSVDVAFDPDMEGDVKAKLRLGSNAFVWDTVVFGTGVAPTPAPTEIPTPTATPTETATETPTSTPTETQGCPSPDLYEDSIVDASDLLICLEAWESKVEPPPADFNCDGVMDALDLFVFQDYWYEMTGPCTCYGSYHIQSQADIDAINRCNIIEGNLSVIYSEITTLNGIERLKRMEGSLDIEDNEFLTSLDGLENLTHVGGTLNIFRNKKISSLEGLQNLTFVGRELVIDSNDSLPSLNGLQNLKSVGLDFYLGGGMGLQGNTSLVSLDGLQGLTTVGGALAIVDNDLLTSLNGLQGLTSVGSLQIGNFFGGNDSLTSLKGLQNLATVEGIFEIANNPSLTDISTLDSVMSLGSPSRISNNYSLNCSGFALPFFPVDESIGNLVDCPTE